MGKNFKKLLVGALGLCPGSWALGPDPGPVPRVLGPGPGPWSCAQGPGPSASWALGPGPGPVSRVLGPGPGPVPRVLGPGPGAKICSEKCKMAKSASEEKMQPRTFRMARIDPSRQGVMNERSFVHGDLYFCPKNAEKVQKRLQTTKNPIPPSIHPYFFL